MIIKYTDLLFRYGVDSKEAKAFKKKVKEESKAFLRRAEVLDKLFRLKEKIRGETRFDQLSRTGLLTEAFLIFGCLSRGGKKSFCLHIVTAGKVAPLAGLQAPVKFRQSPKKNLLSRQTILKFGLGNKHGN